MADAATLSDTSDLLSFTAQIVAAHVAANKIPAGELPALINDVYGALAASGAPVEQPEAPQEPAVPVKRSIQHDYLVCLEDGARVKVLKRYLQSRFGLSPDAYRAKWGLPKDYPMTAPAYAARRSAMAKQFGLGTALRPVEEAAPEAPRLPVKLAAPTVPAPEPEPEPEPEYTAASVFANFAGGEAPAKAATTDAAEKSGRKRFAQQTMRVGGRQGGRR